MIKKIIATLALLCALPVLANAATSYTMTASVSSGTGTASPATLTRYAGVQTTPPFFDFAPGAGFHVDSINGLGLPAGTTYTLKNKSTFAPVTLPAAAGVTVRVSITNLSGPVTLGGVFTNASPVANAGVGQVVLLGSAVTLNGTGSTGASSYVWSQYGGPPVVLNLANPAKPTFTAAATGTYLFTLTVNGGSTSNTYVTTTTSETAAAQAACNDCHAKNGIGQTAPNNIYLNWSSSIHSRSGHSFCSSCHVGTDIGGHYGNVNVQTVNPSTFLTTVPNVNGTLAQGAIFCTYCHKTPYAIPHPTNLNPGQSCSKCHTDPTGHNAGTGDAHSIAELPKCIECHSVAQAQVAPGLVNDNNGVRSITQEFAKWSHHVTGVTLNDAHCAACHLEGKVSGGAIAIDSTKHMVDGMTHLRNAATDADMQWDPAAPNHTTMDNFCMSCHSAAGATSAMSLQIQAYINANGIAATGKTASAKNPFGDTISNRYDKLQRPGVTNVDNQFDTANNSHHGVKGPRYSGRTRTAGSRQIASPATFANNSSSLLQGVRSTIYDAGNLNQLYTPLANNGGETAPRTGAAKLGDDSTVHCGDCHTVGQWKPNSSTNADGSATTVAIGAHGSQNEYMLRNTLGTDQRHTMNAFVIGAADGSVKMPAGAVAYDSTTGNVLNIPVGTPIPYQVVAYTNPTGAFLVCYNCHSYRNYGSIYLGTGLDNGTVDGAPGQPHVGEYDQQGRCNGVGNTLPFNGYTTGKATDGTQFASRFMGPVTKYSSAAPYLGEQNPDFGNIFGIQCLNCHNSGSGNAYGGIHGSANDTSWNNGTTDITPASVLAAAGVVPTTKGYYIDGMGNANKNIRFLPGLGDAMHTPGTLGGFTGGSVVPINTAIGPNYTYTTGAVANDTNWEQKQWLQTAATVINPVTGVVTGTASAGAGCYTLGATQQLPANIVKSDVTSGLEGPSVTGEGGPATELTDTWGGCDDHTAGQGKGNHGFLKRIVRPTTY